jgi:hypothetical protein
VWKYISNSTLKREVATAVLLWWLVLGTYLLCRVPITQQVADAALISWLGLAPFVTGLVTLAFGTDWISKQTNIAGPPVNTTTQVKTEVSDNAATTTVTSEPVEPKND